MNNLEAFRDITTFIFDVDGVLTNCDVLVLENGQLLRTMNVRDGFAIKTAIRQGYRVAIITAGNSAGVEIRLKALGIEDVYMGREDKAAAFSELKSKYELDPGKILYMGDDLPDYPVMRKVGFPVCPADAVWEIQGVARYVSPRKGGEGCVRDVIEKVLRLRGNWPHSNE
jgi:3-deoxy-D-manno-octulosonate 8-phosphate phosphatase (KDO 8-P phosphatase)